MSTSHPARIKLETATTVEQERSESASLWDIFSLDLRTLALFRIGLASLVIIDLLTRLPDLRELYSDMGVLPRTALLANQRLSFGILSLHFIGGSTGFEAFLFLIAGLAALAMLVGYRTRLATIISWVLLLSLQSRNPLVMQGDDQIRRLLLFWSMFLPLGAYYSVDSWLRTSNDLLPSRLRSAGTIALMLQVSIIYWANAILKNDPVWRTKGTAAYYALSVDMYATPLGHWLLNFPHFLKLVTLATVPFEFLIPFLLFIPFIYPYTRTISFALIVIFHLALGLGLHLQLFSITCMIAWMAFLPYSAYKRPLNSIIRLFQPLKERIRRLIISRNEFYGRFTRYLRPERIIVKTPKVLTAIVIFSLVCVVQWNVRAVYHNRFPRIFLPVLDRYCLLTRLDQRWGLFAPRPLRNDGWIVLQGKLASGNEIDLFRQGEPVIWDKPSSIPATFSNAHWRNYLMNLGRRENYKFRSDYLRFVCDQWNNQHANEQKVQSVKMYFMLEWTLPDYQYSKPIPLLLADDQCTEVEQPDPVGSDLTLEGLKALGLPED